MGMFSGANSLKFVSKGEQVADDEGRLLDDFLASESFTGSKPGYVFKKGAEGLGYYKDRGPMHVTGDDDGTVVAAADPEYDMDAHLRGDAQVRWARCGAVGLREARSGVAGRRAAAPATAAASAALSLLVLGARDGQQQLIPALHPAGAREAARRGARRGARRSARREPQAQAGPAPAARPSPAAPRAGARASAQPPARVAGGPARRGAAAGHARRVTLWRRFTPGRLGCVRMARPGAPRRLTRPPPPPFPVLTGQVSSLPSY